MVVGSVLPWWQVGGTPGITAESGNGLAGSGILVFLVGIATLALVALPYAAGDRPLGLDRWLSFAILAVAGWIGFAWRVVDLLLAGAFQFSHPGRGPDQRSRAVAGRRSGWPSSSRAAYVMTRESAYRLPLGQRPDHAAIDRHDRAGDVGRGRRQQERRDAAKLEWVAIAAERDAVDRLRARPPRPSARWRPLGRIELRDPVRGEAAGREAIDPDRDDLRRPST